jgi:protein-disulfide isomerase
MENNSFLSKFSPKQNFIIGIGIALALFFTIGFFILLTVVMRGGDLSLGKSNITNNQPAAVAPAQDDPAPQPSGEISLAAVTDKDWIKGKKNVKVSVVEYSDTECPFCKRFHPTMQRLIKEYPNDVNWVYRHFPLTSIHSKAPKEAEATECAGELAGNDGFWKYIDRLFEITPANNGLDPAQLPQIAEDVGINRKKFEECLNSGKYAQKVQDQANGGAAAGVRGTPYSVVVAGDQKIPVNGAVPFEQLKTIVDSALQK